MCWLLFFLCDLNQKGYIQFLFFEKIHKQFLWLQKFSSSSCGVASSRILQKEHCKQLSEQGGFFSITQQVQEAGNIHQIWSSYHHHYQPFVCKDLHGRLSNRKKNQPSSLWQLWETLLCNRWTLRRPCSCR